jgi:polysaccharide deacetylase 2 family uncharacterized protein YibQ
VPRLPGWRILGRVWAGIGAVLGGLVLVLAALGPPEATEVALAASDPPGAEAAPLASPAAPVPPAATPAAAAAAAPPAAPPAPEPPPLVEAALREAVAADRPIPPPDPALLEPNRQGAIPRVGPDGRTSIRAYGRAFERSDQRPRAAIVVGSIGLSGPLSEDAIGRLPPQVALAISPYARALDPVLERARARGMETLVALPLEPAGYPLNDPGDRALLTGLALVENLDRLDWALTRFGGYVGAIGALGGMRGERFAAMPELLGTLQDVLRIRGLLYVEPRPGAPAPPRAWGRAVDVVLDEPATRSEIDRRLAELERLARERGTALGLAGDPTPVLVDRVVVWAAGLEQRGVVLAPVTATIRRPEGIPPGAAAASEANRR